jgi:hypothetical protein
MSNMKEIIEKRDAPLSEDTELVCKWLERKQAVDNSLSPAILNGLDAIGCLQFELKGRCSKDEGYGNLLSAKIFQTFGVYNAGIAAAAFMDCINCIVPFSDIREMGPDKGEAFLVRHCENILSLFQEMRPRDSIELMIVTKLIILNYLSSHDFAMSFAANTDEKRTIRQSRGIKLSRLFLEFKDRFDKHRRPEQQIHVQHNHIYNEGQAIIGSQLSMGGGS